MVKIGLAATIGQLLKGKGCHIGVGVRIDSRHIVILHRHYLVTARYRDSSAVGEAALGGVLEVRVFRTNRVRFQISRCVTVVVVFIN